MQKALQTMYTVSSKAGLCLHCLPTHISFRKFRKITASRDAVDPVDILSVKNDAVSVAKSGACVTYLVTEIKFLHSQSIVQQIKPLKLLFKVACLKIQLTLL